MGNNVTIYVGALITLIVGLLVVVVFPYIKSKTTGQQYKNIKDFANIVVYAVEQIFGPKTGEKKLEEAMKLLKEFVEKYGYKVDESEIRAMIEAAVLKLKKAFEEDKEE